MDKRGDNFQGVEVFVAYAHEDRRSKQALLKHSKILERSGVISVWHDGKIEPGTEWEEQIQEKLARSQIIVLLICTDFINSDYCWNVEMPEALRRHDAGEVRVMPVITQPCKWELLPVKKLQILPEGDKPVSKWRPQVDAWLQVTEAIEKYASSLIDLQKAQTAAGKKQTGPSKKEDKKTSGFRRKDSKKRYKKLKKEIVQALVASPAAMTKLMERLAPEQKTPVADKRAVWLVDRLMDIDFAEGKSVLLDTHEELEENDETKGVEAIVNMSRRLIPWLFVLDQQLDIEPWEWESIDNIRRIPAGIKTFAEVVMAGIDRRGVKWEKITSDDDFPLGGFSTAFQPESGISDITASNLREDLYKKVRPASDFVAARDKKKDDAINSRMEHWLRKGYRVYLICQMPADEVERDQYKIQVGLIQERYPILAIITLEDDLMVEHQSLFDEIRDLML